MAPIISKLKVISRNTDYYVKQTKYEDARISRNYNPDVHPHQLAREYKKALNAVKIERFMAKPFVRDLPHREGVFCMARHPHSVGSLFSGTYKGGLHLWDIRSGKQLWGIQAHNADVCGLAADNTGELFYSVGLDKTIKCWSYDEIHKQSDPTSVFKGTGAADHICEPVKTYESNTIMTGITHHHSLPQFITAGQKVLLWHAEKNVAIRSFDWNDTRKGLSQCSAVCVKFNKIDTNLFASGDADNHVVLYDIRDQATKKLKMKLRINDLSWNPMESYIFSVASDDYSCYTFDIRMMDSLKRILLQHSGHTQAVTTIDYSPTGREFVTGSSDKSIRIFDIEESRSREVYHTKRMHRVGCVLFSADGSFVFSGSSDHNARVWKANASEKLGPMSYKEKVALRSAEILKEKYAHNPEIRRIARHRLVPRSIQAAKKEHFRIRSSRKRREINKMEHSVPGSHPVETALEKPVFGTQDELSGDDEREEKEFRQLKEFVKEVQKKKKNQKKKEKEEEMEEDNNNK